MMGASILSFTYCGSALCSIHDALFISSLDSCFLFSILLLFLFYPISYTKSWECMRWCMEVLHTEAIISRTPVVVFNRLLAANGGTLWCHTSMHRTTQATLKGNNLGFLFWLIHFSFKFYLLFFLCFFTYNRSSFQSKAFLDDSLQSPICNRLLVM